MSPHACGAVEIGLHYTNNRARERYYLAPLRLAFFVQRSSRRLGIVFIAALLAAMFAAPATAAITYVQGTSAVGSAATQSVAFPSAQSAGHLNVVIVKLGGAPPTYQIAAIYDTAGNTYEVAGYTVIGAGAQVIMFAKNTIAAAGNTVYLDFTAATTAEIVLLEYSGVDNTAPLQGFADGSGLGTSATSGTVSATSAGDLLLGVITVDSGTVSAGADFTQRFFTPAGSLVEDRVVTSAGTYAASGAISTTAGWLAHVVAFRGAASPPGPQTAGAVTYQYDSFGRLKQVTVVPN